MLGDFFFSIPNYSLCHREEVEIFMTQLLDSGKSLTLGNVIKSDLCPCCDSDQKLLVGLFLELFF